MLISHNKVLLEPCNEEINIKEIITVKDATYELVQRKPENSGLLGFKPWTLWYQCRTRTNNIFFIVTTAGKEKPTMWQDLKIMIIILERNVSPSQSHSQILIPCAWHCWQSNSRSYSKSGIYSFVSPNKLQPSLGIMLDRAYGIFLAAEFSLQN